MPTRSQAHMLRTGRTTSGGLSPAPDPGPTPGSWQIESIWPLAVTGSSAPDTNAVGINNGTVFTVTVAGKLKSIRWWRGNSAMGTAAAVGIYSASATALATKTGTVTTAVGWKEFIFDTPVDLVPGTTYTAAVWQAANAGAIHYTTEPEYYDQGRQAWSQTGRIRSTSGCYDYGAAAKPTTTTFYAYYIDPVIDFQTAAVAIKPANWMADPSLGFPLKAGYPDHTNTGIPLTTALTVLPYGYRNFKVGQVVEGIEVWGQLLVSYDNVTVKNCRVFGDGYHALYVQVPAQNCTVQDCYVRNYALTEGANAITAARTTLRCDVAVCDNGVLPQGSVSGAGLVQDCFFHGFAVPPGSVGDPHYDGIEVDGGGYMTFRHNTILLNQSQTSTVQLNNYLADCSDILVDDNYLAGGGYTVALRQFFTYTIKRISFTNNKLVRGLYGYWDIQVGTVPPNETPTWTGNVDAATGAAVAGP